MQITGRCPPSRLTSSSRPCPKLHTASPCNPHATSSTRPHIVVACRSSEEDKQPATVSVSNLAAAPPAATPSTSTTSSSSVTSSQEGTTTTRRVKRQAESTDAVASFLSRRFGLTGGLAWLGFLAVGTLGEQIKTRMEVAAEKTGTQELEGSPEVVTPSGLTYRDLRRGGGQAPIRGYLVVLDYVAKANGQVFDDTKGRGKPIVFIYGSRPFTAALCPGVEEALSTMKAGGRRVVKVPAALGFGDRGAVLRPTEHVPDKQGVVPPGADLEYDLELVRVSIPPS